MKDKIIRYLTYPELRNHPFAEFVKRKMQRYFQHRGWSTGMESLEGHFIVFNDKAGQHHNWNRLFWFFAMGYIDDIIEQIKAEQEAGKPLEKFTDAEFDKFIYRFWGEDPFKRELPNGEIVDIRGGRK